MIKRVVKKRKIIKSDPKPTRSYRCAGDWCIYTFVLLIVFGIMINHLVFKDVETENEQIVEQKVDNFLRKNLPENATIFEPTFEKLINVELDKLVQRKNQLITELVCGMQCCGIGHRYLNMVSHQLYLNKQYSDFDLKNEYISKIYMENCGPIKDIWAYLLPNTKYKVSTYPPKRSYFCKFQKIKEIQVNTDKHQNHFPEPIALKNPFAEEMVIHSKMPTLMNDTDFQHTVQRLTSLLKNDTKLVSIHFRYGNLNKDGKTVDKDFLKKGRNKFGQHYAHLKEKQIQLSLEEYIHLTSKTVKKLSEQYVGKHIVYYLATDSKLTIDEFKKYFTPNELVITPAHLPDPGNGHNFLWYAMKESRRQKTCNTHTYEDPLFDMKILEKSSLLFIPTPSAFTLPVENMRFQRDELTCYMSTFSLKYDCVQKKKWMNKELFDAEQL